MVSKSEKSMAAEKGVSSNAAKIAAARQVTTNAVVKPATKPVTPITTAETVENAIIESNNNASIGPLHNSPNLLSHLQNIPNLSHMHSSLPKLSLPPNPMAALLGPKFLMSDPSTSTTATTSNDTPPIPSHF